jgi:two-component system cell cycle sensor histidine kinase/response regulator CckA
MMNLALNARDAMPHGGNLHISMAKTGRDDPINCVTCGHVVGEEWVRITVADSGAGIPPDVLPHLFEPFFTTKEVGKGTGLGLAQVYGIVKQHNGHIDVSTEAGKGATFVVYLPALPAPTAAQTSSPTLEPIPEGSGETILIVEDNEMLREVMVDTLDLLNYTVRQAANGRAALEMLHQHGGEIDLVMSDLIMPEMGGRELIQAMRDKGMGTPVVIMSGHPLENDLSNLQTLGVAGWLVKPATLEQLADTLADILGGKS